MARVDRERWCGREDIKRNHTATHLLPRSSEERPRGARQGRRRLLVADRYLRFDFHPL
ncbi:MAG: hypothetical protein Q9N34_07180 [Aquificota bacterium]|nr:hypothetical protein [Aquificota bacterium]